MRDYIRSCVRCARIVRSTGDQRENENKHVCFVAANLINEFSTLANDADDWNTDKNSLIRRGGDLFCGIDRESHWRFLRRFRVTSLRLCSRATRHVFTIIFALMPKWAIVLFPKVVSLILFVSVFITTLIFASRKATMMLWAAYGPLPIVDSQTADICSNSRNVMIY